MYIVRIFGSQMVASGAHAAFVAQYRLGFFIAAGMAAGAVLIAALMREPLAYEFGESACVYASEAACAPAYARIFGTLGGGAADDTDDLSGVFSAFGPTVGLQMLFVLLRAGLAVCHDFTFMAKAAAGSLLLVYVPAILCARLYFDTAVAYYLAMCAGRTTRLAGVCDSRAALRWQVRAALWARRRFRRAHVAPHALPRARPRGAVEPAYGAGVKCEPNVRGGWACRPPRGRRGGGRPARATCVLRGSASGPPINTRRHQHDKVNAPAYRRCELEVEPYRSASGYRVSLHPGFLRAHVHLRVLDTSNNK